MNLIEKYLGEGKELNEVNATYMKKHYSSKGDPENEIVLAWDSAMKIPKGDRDLFSYMQSKINVHVPYNMNFSTAFQQLIVMELNKRLAGKITDYMAANIGTELISSGKQGKRNKTQKAQSDIVTKETVKIMKEWLKKFREIHENYKINTSKLSQFSKPVSAKKAKPAFEEFMGKVIGMAVRTKKNLWGVLRR